MFKTRFIRWANFSELQVVKTSLYFAHPTVYIDYESRDKKDKGLLIFSAKPRIP